MTAGSLTPPQRERDTKVGVLLYDTSDGMDAILSDAVKRLRDRGIRVGGLVQRSGDPLPNGKRQIWVDDISTGQSVRLDLPRGPGSRACILDPDALAQAACMLRRITETRVEVIIVSRFGHAEAGGHGMRPEIADAICSGAAVLISARFGYLDALEGFLGSAAVVLRPSAVAIADWAECAAAFGQREIGGV